MDDSADRIWKWLEASGAKRIRHSGDGNLVSTCPFHKDSKPSFSIRTDNGLFVCYSGKCGVTGNLINFLISALNWNFQKARLAVDRLDIPSLEDLKAVELPAYTDRHAEDGEESSTVREAHLGLYSFCPQYLLERGFAKDVLKDWEIGYDFGTSRVTLPVRDAGGRLVGISKRGVSDSQVPKYLHLGFKKSKILYGSYRAYDVIDHAVICEGQLDAVAWSQALEPFTEVVPLATMGSKVSMNQIKWIARHCKHVILGFDNDSDGRHITLKVGDELQRRLGPGRVASFVDWPEGVKDFGDLLGKTGRELRHFAEGAVAYESARIAIRDRLGKIRPKKRRTDGFQGYASNQRRG